MTNVNIMSINIRYKNDHDKYKWEKRLPILKKIIEKYNPDLIGFQEVTTDQFFDLKNIYSNQYHIYGEYRDDSSDKEMNPIFVKKDKFSLDNTKTIWLSNTPDIKNSVGWDADLARVLTYSRIIDNKTNEAILTFMNTHFDHVGKKARINSSKLVLDIINEINKKYNTPIVLTGDFNTIPKDKFINKLLNNKELINNYSLLNNKENSLTLHNFTGDIKGSPIDYIFIQKPLKTISTKIIRDNIDGIYPSDHYFILSKFEI